MIEIHQLSLALACYVALLGIVPGNDPLELIIGALLRRDSRSRVVRQRRQCFLLVLVILSLHRVVVGLCILQAFLVFLLRKGTLDLVLILNQGQLV